MEWFNLIVQTADFYLLSSAFPDAAKLGESELFNALGDFFNIVAPAFFKAFGVSLIFLSSLFIFTSKGYFQGLNNFITYKINFKFLVLLFISIFLLNMFIDLLIENNIYYCADQDPNSNEKIDKVEGAVEIENVKVVGLHTLAQYLGEAAAYSAGLAAATKLLKGSSMPLGSRIAVTLSLGAGSVLTFKSAQNATHQTGRAYNSRIILEASKIKTQGSSEQTIPSATGSGTDSASGGVGGSTSSSGNVGSNSTSSSSSYPYQSATEVNDIKPDCLSDSGVSSQVMTQIELALSLQIIISYLALVLIIMLAMKIISEYNLAKYLSRWPLVEKLINKIQKLWGHSTNGWLLLGLVFLFIFAVVNCLSLLFIFSHI